ncbi:hypothetical protein KSF_063050 [Reticulibacter mediterranei]|uniref:Uncharacterized protein n=1 Tax=Reticulibacter mediterranei TaxID=2778369 RepID=A0A8J3N6M1_9CHLR|nr:hypothetical protein KSF_063050 [Reticulibacter mediterranei]
MLVREIEFLLAPQVFEEIISPIKELLGKEFVALRRKRNVKRTSVSQSTNISHGSLTSIEFGNDRGRTLRAYLKYAQYLDTTLSEIFTCIAYKMPSNEYASMYIEKKMSEENDIILAVKEAIGILVSKGESITRKKISHLTYISNDIFKKHDSILEIIEENRSKYKKMQKDIYEHDLLYKARDAINYLNERKEPITYKTVGKIIGIHRNAFSRYPSLESFVKENYVYSYQRKGELQEQSLIIEVNKAIKYLQDREEEVTFLALSKIIGTTVWSLRTNASVRRIVLSLSKSQKEEDILPKVLEVIKYLEDIGVGVTTKTICQTIPIHRDRLRSNYQVWDLVTQKTCEYRLSMGNHQKQEEILLSMVKNAIQEITTRGEKVTQARVCEVLNITRQCMRKYSNANAAIKQFVEVQRQQREDDLLIRVQIAIKSLIDNDQIVTPEAIGELISVAPGSLSYHHSVATFIRKAINKQKQMMRLQQRIWKEEEIIQKVHEEVMRLQQLGKRVSVTAIMKNLRMGYATLRYYPKAKKLVDTFKIKNKLK